MKYKYPFIKPEFPSSSEIIEDYEKIIEANWFTNFGPFENELCKRVAAFIGDGIHVTTVANATLGLLIAIRALFTESSIKNEVLMPSFTFAAGAEVLILLGYKPVFVDIQPDSWQMDHIQGLQYLDRNKDKVAGILFCNAFGVGADNVTEWENIAQQYKIPILIDSAAGFGSKYKNGDLLGGRGDCEVFSLHATKPFSVGEGGLVTSRNKNLISTIRKLQNFGFGQDREIEMIGINAKLQELNCAIGVRQLERLAIRISTRQFILSQFKKKLQGTDVSFQQNDDVSAIGFVSLLIPEGKNPENIHKTLNTKGIEVRRYYNPLHEQKGIKERIGIVNKLVNTENVSSRIFSLPVHNTFRDEDVSYIAGEFIKTI